MFLRKLPFSEIDAFDNGARVWSLYAIADANGASLVEAFLLAQLHGGHEKAAKELLAWMDSMVFDSQGPRRWIGSKRCHESVAGEQIYEFIQGPLRLHWFYGQGRCVAILARAVAKKSGKTPKPLAKELKALKAAYQAAAAAGYITFVDAP